MTAIALQSRPNAAAETPRFIRIDGVLVALAAVAGWLDATSYLRVHLFTANMSGNTVLLALAVAGGHTAAATAAGAVAAFVCGTFIGIALSGRIASDVRAGRALLTLEATLLAILALLWWRVTPDELVPRLSIVGLAAFAMGLQQAATSRMHPHPTASTTYMSGTLQRIGAGIPKLLAGQPQQLTFNLLVWAAFAGAAFAVGRVTGAANPALIVVPCAVVGAVALLLPRTRA